jgi:hypothetical protein
VDNQSPEDGSRANFLNVVYVEYTQVMDNVQYSYDAAKQSLSQNFRE